jgi:hypothetical protein
LIVTGNRILRTEYSVPNKKTITCYSLRSSLKTQGRGTIRCIMDKQQIYQSKRILRKTKSQGHRIHQKCGDVYQLCRPLRLETNSRVLSELETLRLDSPRSTMDCVTFSATELIAQVPILPLSLPIPPLRRHRRRLVTFSSEDDKVHYVNYSPPAFTSQICTTNERWYNHDNYIDFKNERKDTIRALYLVKGQLHKLDINEYTVTGLEKSLTYRQVIGRKRQILSYIQMIIEKQKYCNDPIQLRQFSEIITKSSKRPAYIRGLLVHDLLLSSTTCVQEAIAIPEECSGRCKNDV